MHVSAVKTIHLC